MNNIPVMTFFRIYLLVFAPLLGAQYYGQDRALNVLDRIGIIFWIIGIAFEAGGDWQLAVFKANPANKGKVLDTYNDKENAVVFFTTPDGLRFDAGIQRDAVVQYNRAAQSAGLFCKGCNG